MKCFVVNVVFLLPLGFTQCWADLNTRKMPDLDCDFENGICQWKHLGSESYSSHTWERTKGVASKYYDTGPSSDHTSGKGWYLLLSTSRDRSGKKVVLFSPRISTSVDACLSFWYMMHGYDVNYLKVYRTGRFIKANREGKLFSKYGHQGKRWYHAMVNVTKGRYELSFEAEYSGWHGMGDIAIDDISFSYNGGCSYNATELMKDTPRLNCDFEDDLCSWHDVEDDGYIWKQMTIAADTNDRNALPPFTNGSSIAGKHPTGKSGTYIAMSLRGPTMSVGKSGACMSFWYQKFLNKNTFAVVKHDYGTGKYNMGGKSLFETKKQNGLVWDHLQVTLPHGDNFYMVLRVVAYNSMSGFVAVDDLSVTHGGPCPEDKLESKINCDFDTNFCQWYMTTPKDSPDWQRGQGSTPSLYTGPDHDHTKSVNGYYVYLDASKVDKATLYSPFMDVPSEGLCLTFWYHMHGQDVANLSLNYYEFRVKRNRPEKLLHLNQTLWRAEGEHGDKWIFHEISLPRRKDIALGFEAIRGYFPRGDIAIDDIKINSNGRCEKDVTVMTTTTTTKSETVVTTTTAEPPKLSKPTLFAVGKVEPAFENSKVELICDGENTGAEYKWYAKQLDQVSHETVQELQELVNVTTRKFIFNELQLSEAGTYWCQISKLNYLTSEKSNGVDIKVVHDPRPVPEIITEGLSEAEPAIVNRLIQLACGYRIEGATYHWMTTSSAFIDTDLPNNQTLLLRARPEHTGLYSCYVTKDGYSTATSKKFSLNITSGKRCVSDDKCNGQAYAAKCTDMRCECSSDAVLQDNSCELRPKQPKIYTSPGFLEFAHGETFYLVCEAQSPVPSHAAYSFRRNGEPLYDENESQASNILKITNAGDGDDGEYECFVTHRNIDSFHSGSISVQIKDFAMLSCDFVKDLCDWSSQTGPGFVNFSVAISSPDEINSESYPSRSYVHVPEVNGKETPRGLLKSPIIKLTSLDSCLTLWYLMHGSKVYSLTIWKLTFSEDWQEDKGERLWTAVGDHGNKWHHEKITVPAGVDFYVGIEALGTIALDDIVFTYRGAC